jgi:hypothetical protein
MQSDFASTNVGRWQTSLKLHLVFFFVLRACMRGEERPSSVSVHVLLSHASGTFSRWTRLNGLERSLSALPFTSCLTNIEDASYSLHSVTHPFAGTNSFNRSFKSLKYCT